MKPIKDIDSDNNNVSLPETIENKLNEAEIDYEEGRNHTEEEIWGMKQCTKRGLNLYLQSQSSFF